MADWIKRSFGGSAGLTQVPTGRHLGKVQKRFGGGTVMLMIDISGSMNGQPLHEAVRGAQRFVAEAVQARYHVGVMLWNTHVAGLSLPSSDGRESLAVLAGAGASGGNDLHGPLVRCHEILDGLAGDRVVALFGDGDLTPKGQVLQQVARMKADNIRFVTRGLGAHAAVEFAEITDEDASSARVDRVEDLAAGIAGMASTLKPQSGLR